MEIGDQGYAVMTMIGLLGPSSAYDIERFLNRLAGEYWAAPHTQVYRECAQLEEAGLVSAKQEKVGRRRRVFSLTKRGRDALVSWVRTPTERSIEIRDIANLKLLASELSTTEDVRELALAQVTAYDARLRILDGIEDRYAERPELSLRLQNVAMGRALYQAARGFWQRIADEPPTIPS